MGHPGSFGAPEVAGWSSAYLSSFEQGPGRPDAPAAVWRSDTSTGRQLESERTVSGRDGDQPRGNAEKGVASSRLDSRDLHKLLSLVQSRCLICVELMNEHR